MRTPNKTPQWVQDSFDEARRQGRIKTNYAKMEEAIWRCLFVLLRHDAVMPSDSVDALISEARHILLDALKE